MTEIKKKIKNLCEQLNDKDLKQVLFEVRKKRHEEKIAEACTEISTIIYSLQRLANYQKTLLDVPVEVDGQGYFGEISLYNLIKTFQQLQIDIHYIPGEEKYEL